MPTDPKSPYLPFGENKTALQGTEAGKVRDRYAAAPDEEKGALIDQLQLEIYRYAKSVFENQNVPLLTDS